MINHSLQSSVTLSDVKAKGDEITILRDRLLDTRYRRSRTLVYER